MADVSLGDVPMQSGSSQDCRRAADVVFRGGRVSLESDKLSDASDVGAAECR